MPAKAKRVLFVQATEPAAYPPLMHASSLMADAGWEVTFLSAPLAGGSLALPVRPRVKLYSIPMRPSYVMGAADYACYGAAAMGLALRLRPHVVYASDAMGTVPGILAARLVRAALVYHEHDSPTPGALRPWLACARKMAARSARVVVFPNAARARMAHAELGYDDSRLRIVWNVPRQSEVPAYLPIYEQPLVLYYHGSITPYRLPEAVIEAVRRLNGRVRLRIAGYEAPGAPGYIAKLVELGQLSSGPALVEYIGQISRADLMAAAAQSHIGLALIPQNTDDPNMRHMTGASNKPFDYMAAGLALLVSDLPDWFGMFVAPGYARACNPADADSIVAALNWFLDHPEERRAMASRGRAKIEADWNYETQFSSVIQLLTAVT